MYTNSDELFEAALAWKKAAIADGWKIEPLYTVETVDRAARLTKDKFVAFVIIREQPIKAKWRYEISLNLWGPDTLAIRVPEKYNWQDIIKGPRTCNYCGQEDVDTQRVSFAGRCCEKCLPEQRKKLEYPGWYN